MRITPRTLVGLVLGATLLLASALAEVEPDRTTPAAPPAAVDPVSIRLEIYVVSQVTRDDGTREERFAEATEARPGQTVEYRLLVRNVSDETLPAGIVLVTGPVPDGTQFVPNSATPSSNDVLTEYSADGGETFAEPPVIVGSGESRSVVDPTAYDSIRWTVLVDLEPNQVVPLVYRVVVR